MLKVLKKPEQGISHAVLNLKDTIQVVKIIKVISVPERPSRRPELRIIDDSDYNNRQSNETAQQTKLEGESLFSEDVSNSERD